MPLVCLEGLSLFQKIGSHALLITKHSCNAISSFWRGWPWIELYFRVVEICFISVQGLFFSSSCVYLFVQCCPPSPIQNHVGVYAKKQLPYLLRVPVHSTLTDNWKTKVHRGKTVWYNERVKSNLMVITPTASHLTTFLWHYFEPHDIYLFHLGTLCLHHAHIAQSLYTYYVWYCPAFKCLLYPHSMYIAYWVFWHSVLFCWCYFALHACRIATPHLMNSSVSDCEMLNIHLAEFLRMFHIFMIRLLAAADFHMQQSFRSPSSFGCVLNFHSKTKLQDFFGFAFLFRAEKLAF